DVLTDEDGDVIETAELRSVRRAQKPRVGRARAGVVCQQTTQGFTGHESDDELGLVNMKGRIYDPRIGRFLTTDPIIALPFFGQSWNPYSYVLNSPLTLVDPSGFEPEAQEVFVDPEFHNDPEVRRILGCSGLECNHPFFNEVEGSREAAEVGAAAAPVDVSTTGSASGHVPQPVTTAPIDWSRNPYVQVEGGFLAGCCSGRFLSPASGMGCWTPRACWPMGRPEAWMGLAIGQIVGGLALTIGA
ncbi:RHS repeat domain-containing protein, partial [Sorangium sp. So ce1024]|uniref:RHS repeat domain-containing protein n=1 Tax=Sorangium sp. So ce1024 TaxID=3133327 RepID=UPI003F101445